jgi:hypothetical protein
MAGHSHQAGCAGQHGADGEADHDRALGPLAVFDHRDGPHDESEGDGAGAELDGDAGVDLLRGSGKERGRDVSHRSDLQGHGREE